MAELEQAESAKGMTWMDDDDDTKSATTTPATTTKPTAGESQEIQG